VDERTGFFLFSAIALIGALNVVLRRNPIHAALWLVGSFLGVAGIFLTLGSSLLAAIQVMVYAGAIMVLFLFVILLLNLETPRFEGISLARGASLFAAAATGLLLLWPFVGDKRLQGAAVPAVNLPVTAANVGMTLFRRFAVPFEIVSLVLLVAMVGAIHVARRPRRDEPA
jgi:NADH-quinone oxidoreductase subunit J